MRTPLRSLVHKPGNVQVGTPGRHKDTGTDHVAPVVYGVAQDMHQGEVEDEVTRREGVDEEDVSRRLPGLSTLTVNYQSLLPQAPRCTLPSHETLYSTDLYRYRSLP